LDFSEIKMFDFCFQFFVVRQVNCQVASAVHTAYDVLRKGDLSDALSEKGCSYEVKAAQITDFPQIAPYAEKAAQESENSEKIPNYRDENYYI